jgi:hypothetical protein
LETGAASRPASRASAFGRRAAGALKRRQKLRLVGGGGEDDSRRAGGRERLGDVGREADVEQGAECLGEPRPRRQPDGERSGAP